MAIFRAKSTLLREENRQMARAKRHFLPGHVWHITHRCHKKEFLLKFARDHATAESSDRHLIQCIAYIDLNMVRTGVVNHPSEWNFGGYNEILKTKNYVRESKWSQSIAVGSKKLGISGKGPKGWGVGRIISSS